MDETGHEHVVSSLIDLQARLRAEPSQVVDGVRLATVTQLPVAKVSRDPLAILTERVDRLENDLSGLADRLRRVERAEGGVDSEEPRVIEGIEPDLALDLQRLVSERFRVQVADSD
jgi:hypothetical protein